MTTPIPATLFADPAPAPRLERAAAALRAHGFTVEILDDAAAARTRIKDLIPEGASVFTGASETLRLSGIEADINTSGRYQAIRPRVLAMDRATEADDIRRLVLMSASMPDRRRVSLAPVNTVAPSGIRSLTRVRAAAASSRISTVKPCAVSASAVRSRRRAGAGPVNGGAGIGVVMVPPGLFRLGVPTTRPPRL